MNWHDEQGWTWGVDVVGPTRILHTAGQGPTGPDGTVLHPGDVRGQTGADLDDLETVLAEGGHTWRTSSTSTAAPPGWTR